MLTLVRRWRSFTVHATPLFMVVLVLPLIASAGLRPAAGTAPASNAPPAWACAAMIYGTTMPA